jgi:phage tail tape-measure protein
VSESTRRSLCVHSSFSNSSFKTGHVMNKTTSPSKSQSKDANPDPITGAPGSHPVGTGVGAAGAGAVGMAIGAMAGPVGAAVGAVVGAVAGGLAGKATAEAIDPTAEDAYWRENHAERPYAKGGDYTTYQPAYRYGWEARSQYPDRDFADIEPELESNWTAARGKTTLEWANAKHAAKDAWDRVTPGRRDA